MDLFGAAAFRVALAFVAAVGERALRNFRKMIEDGRQATCLDGRLEELAHE